LTSTTVSLPGTRRVMMLAPGEPSRVRAASRARCRSRTSRLPNFGGTQPMRYRASLRAQEPMASTGGWSASH
jgi:hypothetical protein